MNWPDLAPEEGEPRLDVDGREGDEVDDGVPGLSGEGRGGRVRVVNVGRDHLGARDRRPIASG